MTIAAMLGIFALPPVTATGGAAYAAENSPAPPAGQETPPADESPSASKPGPLPLISPISYSAQCSAAPLPPHVQRLCAEATAQLEALRVAAARLPNRRDIRMGITDADERTALAAELYTPIVEGEHSTAGSAQSTGAQFWRAFCLFLVRFCGMGHKRTNN